MSETLVSVITENWGLTLERDTDGSMALTVDSDEGGLGKLKLDSETAIRIGDLAHEIRSLKLGWSEANTCLLILRTIDARWVMDNGITATWLTGADK